MKPKEKKDYAVVYSDNYGTYQVQLFSSTEMPLEELRAKADKFNNNKYGRFAVVVTEPVIVSAFQYLNGMQEEIIRKIKGVENAVGKLADGMVDKSFIQFLKRGDKC